MAERSLYGTMRAPGRRFSSPCLPIRRLTGERGLQALNEFSTVKRLGKKADRSRRHRPRADTVFGKGGDEYDRQCLAFTGQVILQLDAAHAGELDIGDETGRAICARPVQELGSGGECLRGVAEGSYEPLKGHPHRQIIIDDGNDRNLGQARQSFDPTCTSSCQIAPGSRLRKLYIGLLLQLFVRRTPSTSAMRTRSANECAPIFFMM